MKPLLFVVLFTFPAISQAARFEAPVHRLGLFTLGLGFNPGESGGSVIGIGLYSYEYIDTSGVAFRFDPLSIYFWENSKLDRVSVTTFFGPIEQDVSGEVINYIPIWMRYYFNGNPKAKWPFVGLGLGTHHFSTENAYGVEEKGVRKTLVAGELGLDIGGKLFNRGVIALKIFPGSSAKHDTTLFVFTYGFSFGWSSGN